MQAREVALPAAKLRHLQAVTGPEISANPLPSDGRARMVVAVPARNEEGRIARTLRSLGDQLGEHAGRYRVVLLANNCTDHTAAAARQVARTLALPIEVIEEDFPPEQAHIGHARGRALQLAAARLEGQPAGLLATTDADTVVAPDWAAKMREALGTADLVGGRIFTLPEERDAQPRHLRRLQLEDAAYHLLASRLTSILDPEPSDPWPRHHQHFGANMGLRLSAWNQIRVWPQVRCLEDVALMNEMQRLDLRVRHCPQVRAWTSVREHGRVETGLSSQLREWQELQAHGRSWLVPGVCELRTEAQALAALRLFWAQRRTADAELAALWKTEPNALCPALAAPTFGVARELAFRARHGSGEWFEQFPPVPLQEALEDLRSALRLLERSGGLQGQLASD
ncbi:glycosyltransferase [Deinococcus altitudinis]|uniref:glycosyltransferase n=1 Tax=Deinococcus altitudinis TaxID=468914 RepID=UPI003892A9B5